MRLGDFDDVDMAMMVHTTSRTTWTGVFGSSESSNGFVAKSARFIGRAAHAGGAPHQGVNALYAATLAIDAINAQRETYRDEDAVRVHPIMTRGGDLVNVIPNDVRLETYVRGKTRRGDRGRQRQGGPRAEGRARWRWARRSRSPRCPATCRCATTRAGRTLPRQLRARLLGATQWTSSGHGAGSTDMGDIATSDAGAPPLRGRRRRGRGTATTGRSPIPYVAYVLPAKLMALTAVDLLADGARDAHALLDGYRPRMTKDEYLAFMRRAFAEESFDGS